MKNKILIAALFIVFLFSSCPDRFETLSYNDWLKKNLLLQVNLYDSSYVKKQTLPMTNNNGTWKAQATSWVTPTPVYIQFESISTKETFTTDVSSDVGSSGLFHSTRVLKSLKGFNMYCSIAAPTQFPVTFEYDEANKTATIYNN